MKKLIFTNCILAIAVIFSFCAKPDLKEELSSVNTSDLVSDRGVCTVTQFGLSNLATLTFCGTNTNATNCPSCVNGINFTGVEVLSIAGLNLTLTTPITFSVRTNMLTVLNFSTGVGNPTGPIQLAAGDCAKFRIDNNCNIVHIP